MDDESEWYTFAFMESSNLHSYVHCEVAVKEAM